MLERARQGWCVVRLKGGDPYIFGRGGEEAELLARSGVRWEAVPGISSATGVPGVAGIPLTHRNLASSVAFVSAYTAGGESTQTLPNADTLVVFMGLSRLEQIARQAIEEGRAPAMPVAVIERGTLPEQRVITGTLADIAERSRGAGIAGPALIVIGEVVRLREALTSESPRDATPSVENRAGLVLLAHGSSLRSWHDSVDGLASELALAGRFVRTAYLPPVSPGLQEVVAEALEAGVTSLVVVPYFLASGLHVTRDIPQLVAAEVARHRNVSITVADCLEGHPALLTAVLARAAEAEKRVVGCKFQVSS
jgi:precorrin-6B methylase 1